MTKFVCDICQAAEAEFKWSSDLVELNVCKNIECHMEADDIIEDVFEDYREDKDWT